MKQTPPSEQLIIEDIRHEQNPVNKNGNIFSDKTQKHKTPLHQAIIITGNIVLIFTIVLCTFGAFISSFSIQVNISALFWFWFISAVTLSIIVTLFRVKGLPAFIIPALLLLYANITEIVDGGKWVINRVTDIYGTWLPITALFPEARRSMDYEPFMFLASAGVLITTLLAIAICLRRSLFSTVLLTAPIVFLTFVITDTQSDIGYLIGLIAAYLTLLISSAVAPDDYIKRGFITFPAFAVSLIFMFIVYLLSPYSGYIRNNHIINMGNSFRAFSSQIGQFGRLWGGANQGISWAGSLNGVWQFNTDNVIITNSGRLNITDRSLLEIIVNRHGTFYIRGYSMGDFDGISWGKDPVDLRSYTSLDNETMTWIDMSLFDGLARRMPAEIAVKYSIINHGVIVPSAIGETRMNISRTGDLTANITYQPYYIYSPSDIIDELDTVERFFYLDSVHSMVEEIVDQGHLKPEFGNIQYSNWMHEIYTNINEDTAQELRRLARGAGINPDAERYEVVDAVAKFVLTSGSYTLSPEQIPDDVDFATYFFEELKEGYCIHFATAAVLMLRSLDIPARFTSGYVVTVPRGEAERTVELTDANAHAWVEVFYNDIGWLYLEVTPSAGSSYIPQPRPHTPQVNITPEPQEQPPPTPDLSDLERPPEGFNPEDNIGGIPIGGGSGVQNFLRLPTWLFNLIQFVALILLINLALILRSFTMKKIRKKRFEQANTNTAVICMWRYITKLGRKEAVPPKNIEELALKARFSQHKITQEERNEVLTYATRLAYEIYTGRESDIGRLWLKYIRALY